MDEQGFIRKMAGLNVHCVASGTVAEVRLVCTAFLSFLIGSDGWNNVKLYCKLMYWLCLHLLRMERIVFLCRADRC